MNNQDQSQHALYLAPAGPPGPPGGSGPTTTTNSNSGKSAVIDNLLDKQKTFTFKGRGFYNMSPSDDGALNIYSSKIIVTENPADSGQQYRNHYGYRNYNDPTYEPNFIVDDVDNTWRVDDSPFGCGEIYMKYGFPLTGTISTVDNLYIKDVEVKLNYLNYPNPKNLIVWLDIKNAGIPSVTSSGLFSDYKSISDFSSNSNLQSYFNALSGMNTHTIGSMSRIYLLNQEHISNYETNFTLKFSDNVDKNISTTLQNYTHSSELGHVIPVLNNSSIHPTLYAMGYNDLDSILYSGNIKTNQINSPINSFAKFKNIPLKNTEFILNIGLISQLEHNTRVMDNLLINSLAVVGKTTENYKQSNTLNNSLCSWELKIHTDNIRQNSNQDILGKINYSDFVKSGTSSLASGYNFIGNFSGVPYLIPAANINAPHDYLANINKCFYDDPSIGKSVTSLRPSLQENLSTVHMAFLSYSLAVMGGGFGVGTLAGTMAGLYALAAVYEQGGRSDPIVNMLIENRLLNQTEAQDSQFYKPVYRNKFFGSPDRAIICISSDNIYWYTVDVPIFRLINSLVLEKNTYRYTKLRDSIIPNVSNFNYKTVRNYTDLDLAPVVHTFTENVSTLSGLSTTFGDLAEGDMVLLTAQTTSSANGYYMVSSSTWAKVPSISNSYFLQKNNIGSSFTETSLSGGTHIIIDGIRAYNFFDKGESITLRNNTGTNSDTVQDKSYIQTSGGVKTILTLSSVISAEGTIYKDSSNANVLLLYKDKIEPMGSTKTSWMLEKTKNQKGEPINPDNFSVAYGEGSINSGSDILDPLILYKMSFNDNEILETNKLLNNQENDKLKFNQVIIDSAGSTQYVSFTSSDLGKNLLKGYSYTAPDFLSKVYDTDSLFDVDNLESRRLDESLLLKDFASQSFMEIKSDKFKGTTIPDTGSISIENDFQKFIPISFSDTDWTNMGNRLALISTGDGATYLKSLYEKYYSLPNDPSSSGCYSPGTYSAAGCPKTETLQNIKVLEEEKRQLQYALMSPRADSSVTVPFVTGIVATNTDGSYKIRYQPNDYYYWFSLDPEQECTLNDELSAKILKKTRIKPIPLSEVINEGIAGSESHITTSPNGFSMQAEIDEKLSIDGLVYSYEITDAGLAKEKSLWPSTISWDSGETFTYGGLGETGDSKKIMVSRLDSSKSMIVSIEEEYIRPSGTLAKKQGKVKDRISLANTDNLFVKFRNIPRKLRSLDSEDFEKYTYDKQGNLVKARVSSPGSVGYVANNFTCWHCIDPSGQYLENIPPYYKLANEMRYRAFFGSVDGIENKNTPYLDSKEDWEWIPYEYYYDNNVPANGSTTNYGAIAAFLDGQKPKASSSSQPLNYFSIMESSDVSIQQEDGSGFWRVILTFRTKEETKIVRDLVYALSRSDLFARLQKFRETIQLDVSMDVNDVALLSELQNKDPDYSFHNEWDEELDVNEMTPDRIIDFELIKIKAAIYRIPACEAGPERTQYVYTKTTFNKDGSYLRAYLDYEFGRFYWRLYDYQIDPITQKLIIQRINLSSIVHEIFDEIDSLEKERISLSGAKQSEEYKLNFQNRPDLVNYQIIYDADKRIREIDDRLDQIWRTYPLERFFRKIEIATTEDGAFLAVNPASYPCAEHPSRIEPSNIRFGIYGRIKWNSSKDLGSQRQRIRYQNFIDWPEISIEEMREKWR